MYGKQTETAFAAVSRLAQAHASDRPRLSANHIARDRNLSTTAVAKVLSTLGQAGIVTGVPGPNGGYTLAKPPHDITLLDVANLFQRIDFSTYCPFTGGVCGDAGGCTIHQQNHANRQAFINLLARTTFADTLDACAQSDARPANPHRRRA